MKKKEIEKVAKKIVDAVDNIELALKSLSIAESMKAITICQNELIDQILIKIMDNKKDSE